MRLAFPIINLIFGVITLLQTMYCAKTDKEYRKHVGNLLWVKISLISGILSSSSSISLHLFYTSSSIQISISYIFYVIVFTSLCTCIYMNYCIFGLIKLEKEIKELGG